jgi:hypothetical protein
MKRKADWTLILTIVTLAGVIWSAYAKPASWDQAVADMADMKPRVRSLELQMAVILDEMSDLKSIRQHLASIDRKTP